MGALEFVLLYLLCGTVVWFGVYLLAVAISPTEVKATPWRVFKIILVWPAWFFIMFLVLVLGFVLRD